MNDLNPRKYIITYGIYTGLALISWLIMLFILKAHYENSWTRFFTEITIQLVGIILAALAYKKNNGTKSVSLDQQNDTMMRFSHYHNHIKKLVSYGISRCGTIKDGKVPTNYPYVHSVNKDYYTCSFS